MSGRKALLIGINYVGSDGELRVRPSQASFYSGSIRTTLANAVAGMPRGLEERFGVSQ